MHMLDLLRRRLNDDPYDIELRQYCLTDLILHEKWQDLLDLLEETPFVHSCLIEFAVKHLPWKWFDQDRMIKLNERLRIFQSLSVKNGKEEKSSFESYRDERISSSSSSSLSSLTSIQSFHQTIRFFSKAKLYQKSFRWIPMGKGECEIIENNSTEQLFIRFWTWKRTSIELLLRVHLNEVDQFDLCSNHSSSLTIRFQARNQCDYPFSDDLLTYQLKFYTLLDAIRFKEILNDDKTNRLFRSNVEERED